MPTRAFYLSLHAAFDTTLQGAHQQPSLINALLSQAFDCFQGNVQLHATDEQAIACFKGCATCCTLRVSATAPEVLLVARFLKAVTPHLETRGIDLIGRLKTVDAHTSGLGEQARLTLRRFCPFIAQGVCVIYAVRPLACRGHASHEVKACVDAAAGRRDDVPFSMAHRMVRAMVQNAMQSSLRDAGLAWQTYELNRAILLALAHPQAELAWLKGEDVLVDAALNDVPIGEMAHVYDQLRPATVATT